MDNSETLSSSRLLNLPIELLMKLPTYLHDIEDFMNISSSCRTFHNLFDSTSPNLIFQLAAASSRVFFRPSPHLLIAAVASQVGEWAIESPRNRAMFHDSFKTDGIDGLFELCKQIGQLTMKAIRELHEFKLTVLNPLSNSVSRECGPASLSDIAENPQTICEDPENSLLYIAMFGDFFAASVQAVYDPETPQPLSPRIRRDWWEQCCADVYCDASPAIEPPGPLHLNMRSINEVHYSEIWRESWLIACARYAEESGIYFRESTGDPEQDFEITIRKERIWEQTLKGSGMLALEMMLDRELPWTTMAKLVAARELISKMDVTRLGDSSEDRHSDHSWNTRVSARSDIFVCLGWV